MHILLDTLLVRSNVGICIYDENKHSRQSINQSILSAIKLDLAFHRLSLFRFATFVLFRSGRRPTQFRRPASASASASANTWNQLNRRERATSAARRILAGSGVTSHIPSTYSFFSLIFPLRFFYMLSEAFSSIGAGGGDRVTENGAAQRHSTIKTYFPVYTGRCTRSNTSRLISDEISTKRTWWRSKLVKRAKSERPRAHPALPLVVGCSLITTLDWGTRYDRL